VCVLNGFGFEQSVGRVLFSEQIVCLW